MKSTNSNKVTALFLALMVVFSTLSFTVEKHFCGGILIDISVFSNVKKCGMDMPQDEAVNKSCCEDKVDVVKGQDDLKVNSGKEFSFTQNLFLSSFIYSLEGLYQSLPKHIIPHKDYSPPNLIKDIHVLDETFLI